MTDEAVRFSFVGKQAIPLNKFLTQVGVLVTRRTRYIPKPELHGPLIGLMAFRAGDFGMTSEESESGGFVPGSRECGRLERAFRMAGIATIQVWFACKLGFVNIPMGGCAEKSPDAIDHNARCIRDMAFGALRLGMTFFQGKSGRVVLCNSKG
jgi:hypothetical protein